MWQHVWQHVGAFFKLSTHPMSDLGLYFLKKAHDSGTRIFIRMLERIMGTLALFKRNLHDFSIRKLVIKRNLHDFFYKKASYASTSSL